MANFIANTSAERERVLSTPRVGHAGDLVESVQLGYVFLHPPYSTHSPIRTYIETQLPVEVFYERDGLIGYRVVEINR